MGKGGLKGRLGEMLNGQGHRARVGGRGSSPASQGVNHSGLGQNPRLGSPSCVGSGEACPHTQLLENTHPLGQALTHLPGGPWKALKASPSVANQ